METDHVGEYQSVPSEVRLQKETGATAQFIDTLCVELTARCPLHCLHCSANAAPERQEVLPAHILGTQLVALAGLREIYLSGGEPFEHPELIPIVRSAAQVAPLVVAYSSGTRIGVRGIEPLPCDLLERVRDAGLARVDLSLYAGAAAVHDEVTTVPGSFAATCETARRVRVAGLRLGVHFVPVGMAGTHVAAMAELAATLGAERLHVLALTPQGRAKTHFAKHGPPAHFWALLEQVADRPGECELLLSSALRHALGRTVGTPRDRLTAAFLDARGYLYPGEGCRTPRARSRGSILDGSHLQELFREVGFVHRAQRSLD